MSVYKSHGHEPDREDTSSSVGPLVAYGPSAEETTPLLPGKTRLTMPRDGCKLATYYLLALLAFLFVSVNLSLHFFNCPLYPWSMNAIRREWENEVAQHGTIKDGWKLQTEWHERDVARRIREEDERQERARKEWAQEVEKHRHEREEMERREENERQKWRREVEDHDRIEEERKKREEEERQKLNMFWGDIKARTCTTYATREYTAQLMNLPATWEYRVEACKATPLEVHGITYLPKSCEDKGPGVVIGKWEINRFVPDCATFWNRYKDKERSGKRRIEHYLENLPIGSDWREFCATTPASFRGMEFSGAQECFQYKSGTYGHWEIADAKCQ